MIALVLVGAAALLAHFGLVGLLRRARPGCGPPVWLRTGWLALLVAVAAVAIWRAIPVTGLLEALGALWVVPAADVVVLLIVVVTLDDRREVAPMADRRRLMFGVLTTGVLAVAAGAAGAAGRGAQAAAGEQLTPPGRAGPPSTDPLTHGAAGDYTGRFGSPGEGSDSREGIQAALDAASDVVGSGYYDYITRRSTTVRLAPGHYVVGAPADGASLVIPPGVLLDATDATLYFDYPATPRATWCGIEVGQYGQLRIGKVYPSGRTRAPDAEPVYDAVRLVQTDDNSHVIGYGDSEIRGWQGAAIRGVGAWLVYVQGLRIADNVYGYVASRTGDGTLGYTVEQVGHSPQRNHADLRIQDCYFVNLTRGGIVGAVTGDAGGLLTPDHESLNFTIGLSGCAFERIAGYALDITSAMVVAAWDCAFEEVGAGGRAMIRLDNCRAASFGGIRVNLAGAPGEVRPVPQHIFEVGTTEGLVVDGMHVFNSLNPALRLADAQPRSSWRTADIHAGNALAPGPMYAGAAALGLSGAWDKGHLVLGSHHLWVDGAGRLRHKDGPPGADTDGTVLA